MKKLKFFMLIILSLIMMITCSNCKQQKKEAKPQKEVKEVTFWTIQLSPFFDDYIEKLIDEYEKSNPDVKIIWSDIPWADIEKRLLAQLAERDMPDVINLNPNQAQQFAQLGELLNIEKHSPEIKTKYFDGAWEACRFKGDNFGLPWYLTTPLLIYNKELFRQAGLTQEDVPTNFDELYQIAKQITEKTGKFAYMISISEQFDQMNMKLVSDDYSRVTFVKKPVIDMITIIKKMINEGIMPIESLSEGMSYVTKNYGDGNVAIMSGGTSFLSLFEKNHSKVYQNTGLGMRLENEIKNPSISVMALTVAKSSGNVDKALDFAVFVTNEQNQVEFAKISGAIIPSTKGSIKDEFFKKESNPKELARKLSALQVENAKILIPPIKNWSAIKNIFIDAIREIILEDVPVEKKLKEAEKYANIILKD